MKNTLLTLLVGLGFGLIDLIPLIPTNAPLFNMLAILVFWIVVAFVFSRMRLLKNNWLDGLVLAVLLMMPLILTVTAVNPKDFFPMLSMAVILGPLCAAALGKLNLRG
jgi:hypothetical protein